MRWVAPTPNLDDPDFHYYVELDPDNPPRQLSGPRAGEIVPLPLILHPGNLIEPADFSGAPRRQFQHRRNNDVFVGNILKVEIHGCATGGRQDEAPKRVLCSASTNDPQTPPADWVAADDLEVNEKYPNGRSDIWWPFHQRRPLDFQPGEIQNGDYVRLVGTLWEDDPHDHGRCWDSDDEGGHGWFELHPVDFMAKFNDFAPNPRQSTAQVIAACGGGEVDVDLRPPGPQPAGTVPRFEEVLRVNERTTRRFTTHSNRITVHLDVGGRFWGYYRVYWGSPLPPPPPPPPQRCPAMPPQKCCGNTNPDGTCEGECVPLNNPCP